MSFNHKTFNNIAGSLGKLNVWLYITPDTKGEMIVAQYFNEAIKVGLRDRDFVFIVTTSTDVNYMTVARIESGNVVIYSTEPWA